MAVVGVECIKHTGQAVLLPKLFNQLDNLPNQMDIRFNISFG